ncbi:MULTISPECIES: hypothetical protein [Enterococcus]|uniref:hypothetical protein n=1 Tax=Enterococcus TaxID=1350 RepID=UPI000A39A636|nr:hypothetical protein [Enterococcus sp. 4E1_DIV0656]OTO09293.1 hypothetical protein A5882_003626 [Enterococcus sp. 4E1_DIV0656]
MDYEVIATAVVFAGLIALLGLRFVKGKKAGETTGNTAIDILTIAAPLIDQAIESVNAAKEDGVVTEEEMIKLVSNQLHTLMLEAPLTDGEKALITPALVEFATKQLMKPLLNKK